ncbi:MAG: ABC transporter permease [Candidatus Binatia bacterium]
MAIPLQYPVRNLFVRRWTSAFTAGGIALVVAVTILLAALVGGLKHMLVATGEPDNLIVMRKGSTNDGSSFITRDAAQAVRVMTGVAQTPEGQPIASTEIVNQPFMRTRSGSRENVLVRGVAPDAALRVHRSVHLAAGRFFQPKMGEVVVGRGVLARYAGVALGSPIEFGRRRWTVVGVFDSGGTAFDSEIWADVRDVQDDTRRTGYSSVRLTVAPGADRRSLIDRIAADARFALEAKPEEDYYREQADTANSLYVLVLTLAVIMAIGATFGAANTMYAAVAGRTSEIGTLRALGFGQGAILTSFLAESLLLAGGGFVTGLALAGLGIFAVNTLLAGVAFGLMTFSVATVTLAPSSGGILLGLGFALAIGLFGGLAPAWRAARLRVVDALHRA